MKIKKNLLSRPDIINDISTRIKISFFSRETTKEKREDGDEEKWKEVANEAHTEGKRKEDRTGRPK